MTDSLAEQWEDCNGEVALAALQLHEASVRFAAAIAAKAAVRQALRDAGVPITIQELGIRKKTT